MTTMKRFEDVLIVGAGPAGAYCALTLAKKGIKPVIVDNSHPREKPCGGGISPPVLKKFPFLEQFRSKGFTFGNFRIITCIDTQVMTKSLENGFCISRKYLDKEILEIAVQNGTKLISEKVLDVQKKGKNWNVITNKSTFSTKVLVGADGVNSIVRRKTIGRISPKNLALTFGYITTSLKKKDATIKFLNEIPGYIWVFPGKGYGDAAGHVDPISGGGIIYALWGGELAAQAIESNDPKSFDKAWKKAYGDFFKERCKNKEAFYDSILSTLSIFRGLINRTYFLPQKDSWQEQSGKSEEKYLA
ncbi:MAG: NAD(P)/FAD-dependent oxidoreductase [Candidatus Bathyarchaeota archaeon]